MTKSYRQGTPQNGGRAWQGPICRFGCGWKLETNYWQSYTLWIRQWVSHPSILVFPSIFRYHIVPKPNYIVDFLVIISGECLDSHAIQTIRFFATPTAEKCETRMLVRWWFCYSIIIPLNPQYIPKKNYIHQEFLYPYLNFNVNPPYSSGIPINKYIYI